LLIFVDMFSEAHSGTSSTMDKTDPKTHLSLLDMRSFSPPMVLWSQTSIDHTKSLRVSNGIALLLMKVRFP